MNILVLNDWEKGRLLFSDDRLRIIDLLRDDALSTSRISEFTGLNPGSVHNHIKKLLQAGIVIAVDQQEPQARRGAPEKKYRLAADDVLIGDVGSDRPKLVRAVAKRAHKDTEVVLSDARGRARRFEGYLTDEDYDEVMSTLDALSKRFHSTPPEDQTSWRVRFFYLLGDV